MIRKFKTNKELTKYISGKNITLLSNVTEGTCYLGEDNKVYKIIGLDSIVDVSYNIDDIITEDDIKLKSFAFPQELFVVDNKLAGYSSEYIPDNKLKSTDYSIKTVATMDFNKFSRAYKTMKKDVIKLSSKNILINDLCSNIVYDGKRLVGIDTCGYKKVDYNPTKNVQLKKTNITKLFGKRLINTKNNIDSYDYAIECIFRFCYNKMFTPKLKFNGSDIDSYLKNVEDELPDRAKLYREKIIKKRK